MSCPHVGTLAEELNRIKSEAVPSRFELWTLEHIRDAISSPVSYNPATRGYWGLTHLGKTYHFRGTDDQPISWTLPAHGVQRPDCGDVMDADICPTGHYARPIVKHCDRLSCPICGPYAMRSRSETITEKLIACARSFSRSSVGYQHVVISPPQDDASRLIGSVKGYNHLRGSVMRCIEDLGGMYGLAVCHPWREDPEPREDGLRSWRIGPHWHAIVDGFIDINGPIAEIYRSEGWVIKIVKKSDVPVFDKSDSSTWMDEGDVRRCFQYLISHAGIGSVEGRKDLRAYTYTAMMNPSKVVCLGSVRVDECVPCPVCVEDETVPECLHSLVALRSPSPFALPPPVACRVPMCQTEIIKKQKYRVFCLRSHRDRLMSEFSNTSRNLEDLRRILRDYYRMGVLGCVLPLDVEDYYIRLETVSRDGEIIRGDVSQLLYDMWRARGWTAEHFDSVEDLLIREAFSI